MEVERPHAPSEAAASTQPNHIRIAARSSLWLLVEKAFVLGVPFAVSVLLARHLGPGEFGALNYAIAYVAIAGAMASLGLGGGAVVRELVEDPRAAGEIVGTTLVLRAVAGLGAIILAMIVALAAGLSERTLILLIAVALPFEAGTTLRLPFEARVESHQVATATMIATAIGALLRLGGIYADAPLWVFAAIVPLQTVITAAALLVAFRRVGLPVRELQYRASRARQLLQESWPLILSAVGAILYLKVDQFMLGEMAGMAAVGVYSVAARLSEVWYVLPTVVGVSIAPRLLDLRTSRPEMYELRLKQAFRYAFWLGTAVAITMTLVATPLVRFLYGGAYDEAGIILAIHIWACPAVFLGVILQKWFLAERLLVHSFKRHLIGAGVNVGLNLLLIPRWGGVGAAVATVISYTVANFLACFAGRKTFGVGVWMLQAILSPQAVFSGRR